MKWGGWASTCPRCGTKGEVERFGVQLWLLCTECDLQTDLGDVV